MSARAKVQLYGQNRFAYINTDATNGAVIGESVWNPDGSLFVPVEGSASTDDDPRTLWSLVQEVPANVQEVENLTGSGFVRRSGLGAWSASALAYADLPSIGAVDGDALVFSGGAWVPGAVAGAGAVDIRDVWLMG